MRTRLRGIHKSESSLDGGLGLSLTSAWMAGMLVKAVERADAKASGWIKGRPRQLLGVRYMVSCRAVAAPFALRRSSIAANALRGAFCHSQLPLQGDPAVETEGARQHEWRPLCPEVGRQAR